MAEIHAVLRKRGVGIASISVDEREDSAKLSESLALPFPLLEDKDLRVALQWGVDQADRDIAVPSVFVVLPNGTIFWKQIGESIADRPSNAEILDITAKALEATKNK